MAEIELERKAEFVQHIKKALHRLYSTATTASMRIADIKPRLEVLNEYTEELSLDAREDHAQNIRDSSEALAEIQRLMDQILAIVKDERLRTRVYMDEDLG